MESAFDNGGPAYELIRDWIQNGSPRTPADAPRLVRVAVEPASRILAPKERFQLQVVAEYSDGSHRNVTPTSTFQSNDNAIAAVNSDGMLQAGPIAGEAAIMVRYMNHIAVCGVIIPLPGEVPDEVYAESASRSRD